MLLLCTASSSTLIDLIYTNSPDRVVCSGVSHISITDHSLVLSIEFPSRGHNTVTYRKLKNFNSDRFVMTFFCKIGMTFIVMTILTDMWDAWKKVFFSCVDKHARLRTKRVRSCKSPCITSHLKKCMHKRDLLKMKASRSKDSSDWHMFKALRNQVNFEIKQAKVSFYRDALDSNTWRIINQLRSKTSKCSSVKEIVHNGTSITNPDELSNAFNDHFSSIGPRLANKTHHNVASLSHLHYLSNTNCQFELNTIGVTKVHALLSKLCKSKATGLDKISARFLQESGDLVADHLCAIFNKSIVTGIFPDEWKLSKVIPLFKQGNRSNVNNYHPISVIPVVAKVFERIVYDQLCDYLTKNDLISSHQSGFLDLCILLLQHYLKPQITGLTISIMGM